GVMGGLDSEVTDDTTTVLLECATFSTAHTSRTSRNLTLTSESSMRYERGVDANGIEDRSAQAAALIALLSGGTVASGIVDVYPQPVEPKVLPLRTKRLQDFVGAPIPVDFMRKALTRLGCKVEGDDELLQVTAPTFRPDLEREIDLYEEVLRLWGMDQVPMTLPGGPERIGGRNHEQALSYRVGAALRACGMNETITYSFVDPSDLDKLRMPQENRGEAVELINPMSTEQSVMRRSIIPGLLHSVAHNQNHGVKDVQLYEIGTVFAAAEGRKNPKERKLLAGVLCGSWNEPAWNAPAVELGFFDAKGVLENLLRELCVKKIRFKALSADEAPYLQPGRAAQVLSGGTVLGWLGEIHPLALEAYEVNGPVAAFELDMKSLISASNPMRDYVDVPRFPAIDIDLAIVVPEEVTAERLLQCISSAGGNLLESARLFDVYRDPQKVGVGKKSMAVSLRYRDKERTLSSQDVEKVHERLVRKVCGATGGEVRG
ncbi:MAG: phenylalanine--tRNA ligase subunit beta, partial [Coriobacteriales bacterium]|nr:phenylalanine--tRNA ligase subunit beta [Coriobacteriales bacterium]